MFTTLNQILVTIQTFKNVNNFWIFQYLVPQLKNRSVMFKMLILSHPVAMYRIV